MIKNTAALHAAHILENLQKHGHYEIYLHLWCVLAGFEQIQDGSELEHNNISIEKRVELLERKTLHQPDAFYRLIQQLQNIDFLTLDKDFQNAIVIETRDKNNDLSDASKSHIQPFPESDIKQPTDKERQYYFEHGMLYICAGQVAVVLLAGGQGTRLGISAPKGTFDIGLPSHKSLFHLHAERIHRLQKIASSSTHENAATSSRIPWYIMTSAATHNETIKFFKKHNYFGLSDSDVFFFQQAEIPALNLDGKLLLSENDSIMLSPNGNGDVFNALRCSNALVHMQIRGIKYIQVYGVDNVLVKVADPALVGFAVEHNADVVNKVVMKSDPHEQVGVMAFRNGKPSIVEYSELSVEMAKSRNFEGQLLYRAANIVQHLFTVSFLQRIAPHHLRYHIARKIMPYFCNGNIVEPSEPNCIKLELFVFDSFKFANNLLGYAVSRQDEFSAVKNAIGANSPATALNDVTRLNIRLIKAAGGKIAPIECNHTFDNACKLCAVEISPLLSYQGEGLEFSGRTFTRPICIQ